jgi:hypothetical protein
MKRRSFIIAASSVAVGLPAAYYVNRQNNAVNPLATPDLLGRFCSQKTLHAIGNSYRTLVPEENEKQKLIDIILTDDTNGKKIKISDTAGIEELVTKKVQQDFLANKTMIIKGWVISKTEARQCALFSFPQI